MIFFLFVFQYTACCTWFEDCDPPPCNPMPCDSVGVKPKPGDPDLNILWQYNPDTVNNSCLSMPPVIYKDIVVFSNMYGNKSGNPYVFLNKKTGELLQTIDDPDNLKWRTGSRYIFNNIAVFTDWHRVYIINLDTREQIRKFSLRDYGYEGSPRFTGLGHLVFLAARPIGHPREKYIECYLTYNLLTQELTEIIRIEDSETFEPSFESLGFWFKPDGDTLMIFQNRQYDFKSARRRIDLYGYNMSNAKIEWKIDSITITGNTSVFPIIVKNDRFYFQGSNEAFCFSCKDGSLIWNRYFNGESFFRTNALLAEGKYILKSESSLMIALDENTGNTVWENPIAGHSNSNMIYHKAYVYYETGQDGFGVLRRLFVHNGSTDWTYNSSNRFKFSDASFGLSGIAIDPETNLIYANDRIFHMCIKLPL